MEWATTFMMAEKAVDGGATRVVPGGGPGISDDTVWWFACADEIENVDAEVKSRLTIANHRCGTDLTEQRVAQDVTMRNWLHFRLRFHNAANAADEAHRHAGRRTLRSFRWGY